MSYSVQPHRRQPTKLPCPWVSPGKNTGVGFHFLLQCMKVKSESEATQSCPTLSDPMDCSLPSSSHPWDFPGKSTGVGCHCLLPAKAGYAQISWLRCLSKLRNTNFVNVNLQKPRTKAHPLRARVYHLPFGRSLTFQVYY